MASSAFFFNDTATTEIYTLSLHDALPIYGGRRAASDRGSPRTLIASPHSRLSMVPDRPTFVGGRSEEHTSELQSRPHLVCRLLLEQKKQQRSVLRHGRQFTRGGLEGERHP